MILPDTFPAAAAADEENGGTLLAPGTGEARVGGRFQAGQITNLEGRREFDVRWAWEEGPLEEGFTAVVRVKNERRSLPRVLPPLLRAVRRVVLVDNGSTDGSAELAREVAEGAGAGDRLELHRYPFAVSRCGPEHLETPPGSLHSLTYFYNWSFSHVRTAYALKWDGDMVMSDALVAALRDLVWQLTAAERVIRIPRYPLYVADDRRAFLDTAMENCEPWAWPNRPGYAFGKGFEWELWTPPDGVATIVMPDWSCVELKHLDTDEFAHWSDTDFGASARTRRKERETAVFAALASGESRPEGILPVTAPPGMHVVDYVRAQVLPALARESSTSQPEAAPPS